MTTPALTRLAMLTALAACHGHDHAPPVPPTTMAMARPARPSCLASR